MREAYPRFLLSAGALNFRDVMLAYGKLSRDMMAHGKGGDYIGLEFSGRVMYLWGLLSDCPSANNKNTQLGLVIRWRLTVIFNSRLEVTKFQLHKSDLQNCLK